MAERTITTSAPPAETGPGPGAPRSGVSWRDAFGWVGRLQATVPTVVLVLLVLAIGMSHPQFFSGYAIQGNVRAASIVAVIAFGMVFLLAMGEIDLSVGGVYATSFYVTAVLGSAGLDMYLAAVAGIAVGVLMGLANSVFVRLFRAPVIIVTLGSYSLYRGVVEVVAGGDTIGQDLPYSSSFFTVLGGTLLGVPVAGWIALVLMVVLTVVLSRSRMGAMIRAVGSNRSAAEFSGIPAQRLRTYALMLTGGLAGLSGVLTLAYSRGGDAAIGSGLELQVIAAAIIGGTAVTGGSGSVPGGLVGALLVVTINSGLIFFGVDPLWTNIVTGLVILLAVGTAAFLAHRRAGLRARGIAH